MGEYNGTCGISHLPIAEGDPVAAILLTPYPHQASDGFGGNVGTGKAWQAASLPYAGSYNGIGTFEPDAGYDDFFVRDMFGRSLKDMLQSHEDGEPIEYGTRKVPVRLMLVHRELFDRLTASCARGEFQAERGRIGEALDAARAMHGDDEGPARFDVLRDAETWSDGNGRHWTEKPYASRVLERGDGDGISHALGRAVISLLNDMERMGEREAQVDLMARLMRLKMLDENMSTLRRSWSPQGGMGRTEEDYDLHREVAEWASARAAEATDDARPRR